MHTNAEFKNGIQKENTVV